MNLYTIKKCKIFNGNRCSGEKKNQLQFLTIPVEYIFNKIFVFSRGKSLAGK
jgi:hypothetical protein